MLKNGKFISLFCAAALLAGQFVAADEPAAQPAKNDEISQTDILRVSEAFGHFIGRNIKSPGIQLDLDSIIKGMRDGSAGKPAPMNDKDYEALMMRVQEVAFKKLSNENLKAANAYLEKNAKEPNIIVIEPGKLQYSITKEGTGATVEQHNSPQIEYTGKYIDGTVFGSSAETGAPITIPLDQTIPGFSKGIVGMKEGEERRLYVHPDLGYGTTGQLAPNSMLIFDVKVVKANSPAADKGADMTDGMGDDDEIDIEEIDLDEPAAVDQK